MSVSANKPGSCHDSTIFKDSKIGQDFAAGHFAYGFLLGDSGYACTPYLLTPYGSPSSRKEIRFNRAHMKTRCTVECSFGILKARFRCIRDSALLMEPSRACKYVIIIFSSR